MKAKRRLHEHNTKVDFCPQCGVVIIGTKRKVFCSSSCKTRFNYVKAKKELLSSKMKSLTLALMKVSGFPHPRVRAFTIAIITDQIIDVHKQRLHYGLASQKDNEQLNSAIESVEKLLYRLGVASPINRD